MDLGGTIGARFELESPVAHGGMGVVYRGRDRLTGLPVAVKTVLGSSGVQMAERFTREARVLAELEHPAIVQYIAHGVIPPDWMYLVMEWLDGVDLARRLRQSGSLAVHESLALIRRIAEALALAHARGVVHRDIKPANIYLVDSDVERAKIVDFGVARQDVATERLTHTGAVVGTPFYMAPEQAAGERAIGPQADLFSLGCVWFECLTGRPPFVAKSPFAINNVLFEDRPSLRELRPDVSAEVGAVISSLLALDPTRRPRDASSLVAAIGALQVAAQPTSVAASAPPAKLTSSEQRLLCLIVAGVARPSIPEDCPTIDLAGDFADADPSLLRPLVAQYGGTVTRVGDGVVLITLEGSGPATDQAALAGHCALAVRSARPELSVVLATGRAQPTRVGPAGPAIERALALLRAPAPAMTGGRGEIAIDEVTAGLLDGRFEVVRTAGGFFLGGEREPGQFAGEMRTLLGRPTPCLGRESELATLDAIFAQCVSEPMPRAVLVTAPAGVGKSRLRCELVQRIRDRGDPVRVLMACGDPMSAGSLFGLIAQILRQVAGISAGDTPRSRWEKLHARLAHHLDGAALAMAEEFLGELVGAASPAPASLALVSARADPRSMGEQLRAAWESWLAAEARAQPVVIILEDLHWGDLPSVKFVDGALRRLADEPLLVAAFARPEVHDTFPGLWSERNVHELRLGGLTRRASERLVRHALGDAADDALARRLAAQADGNAFYLEELIRAVADGRASKLPEAVLGMVEARLEALAPEARRVLRAGSVFGEVFWDGGVATLLGGEAETAAAWLRLLVDEEVLVRRAPARYAGETEYAFRHGLLREAAYATLTEADRTAGHRLAAGWLLRLGEREPLVIAEHFERGRDTESAIPWLLEAAMTAWQGADLSSAVSVASRGVSCGARGDVRGRLLALQSEAYNWMGNPAECIAKGMEALRFIAAGDPLVFHVASAVMLYAPAMDDRAAVGAILERLRSEPFPDQLSPDCARAIWGLPVPLFIAGDPELAHQILRRLEPHRALVAERDPVTAGWIHQTFCVKAYFATCDLWLMLTEAQAAYQCFQRGRDRMGCMPSRFSYGSALCELGAYDEAEAALREVLTLVGTESGEFVIWDIYARIALGVLHRRRGDLDEAQRILTACVEEMARAGDPYREGLCRIDLALVCAERGDLDDAHRNSAQATTLLKWVPYLCAFGLAVEAHVLVRLGRAAEAIERATQAARYSDQLGSMVSHAPMVRLALAEALLAGRDAAARAAVLDAKARLLGRAERIPDPRYRELFLRAVPENRRTLALAEAMNASR